MRCKGLNRECTLESRHMGSCKRSESVVNKDADVVNRQTAWQRANRDRYNARMRAYMKRRRADVKAGKKPLGIAYG